MALSTKPFADMWLATCGNRVAQLPEKAFSSHLLMAMMWEESLFQNIHQQHGAGNAYGFGQVEEWIIQQINKRYKTGYSGPGVLKDEKSSIEVVSYALKLAYDDPRAKNNVDKALNIYATGKPDVTPGVVLNWRNCEKDLATISSLKTASTSAPVLSSDEVQTAKTALHKARQNGDGAFGLAFP